MRSGLIPTHRLSEEPGVGVGVWGGPYSGLVPQSQGCSGSPARLPWDSSPTEAGPGVGGGLGPKKKEKEGKKMGLGQLDIHMNLEPYLIQYKNQLQMNSRFKDQSLKIKLLEEQRTFCRVGKDYNQNTESAYHKGKN